MKARMNVFGRFFMSIFGIFVVGRRRYHNAFWDGITEIRIVPVVPGERLHTEGHRGVWPHGRRSNLLCCRVILQRLHAPD